jgi:hypothetical protein
MSSLAGPEPGASPPGLRRLRLVRIISAAVVAVSILSLGLCALAGPRTVTTHTTVTKGVAADRRRPATVQPSQVAAPAAPAPLVAAAPLVSTTPSPAVVPVTSVVTVPNTPSSRSTPAAPPSSSSPATSPVAPALPACPLALPAANTSGGLASLIGLSPLFGPFSAEAFASAAAFQPLLQLFGPFLISFASVYASAAPSLTPLITQFEALENEGFSVLSPLYGPSREQVLTAETQLAGTLAPYAQSAASNPAASCLVDIEGILTSASAT